HQGKTIIMVVHDLVSACRFADHIVAMKDGQILAAGAPEQIITADLIKALYGVHCKVIKDPYNGTIMLGDVQSAYRRQKNLNVAYKNHLIEAVFLWLSSMRIAIKS